MIGSPSALFSKNCSNFRFRWRSKKYTLYIYKKCKTWLFYAVKDWSPGNPFISPIRFPVHQRHPICTNRWMESINDFFTEQPGLFEIAACGQAVPLCRACCLTEPEQWSDRCGGVHNCRVAYVLVWWTWTTLRVTSLVTLPVPLPISYTSPPPWVPF